MTNIVWTASVDGEPCPDLDMHVVVYTPGVKPETLVKCLHYELECLVKYDMRDALRAAFGREAVSDE